MAIDDWTTEGRMIDAVAVCPQSQVSACELEFKLPGARFSENRNAEVFHSSAVFIHLTLQTFIPIFAGDALNDSSNEIPLSSTEELFTELRLSHMPVCIDAMLSSCSNGRHRTDF